MNGIKILSIILDLSLEELLEYFNQEFITVTNPLTSVYSTIAYLRDDKPFPITVGHILRGDYLIAECFEIVDNFTQWQTPFYLAVDDIFILENGGQIFEDDTI